ncbi:hypothetical protein [Embleya hyalina]|uniref:hypothetical protein n=1 Tax=Embleya hyalina TaxID=516124 RepID=UPI000F817B28|nr:hypothetical protein [Embleya hyalina]
MRITLDATPVPEGSSLWLVAKVPNIGSPPSTRFYAKAPVPTTPGDHELPLDLSGAQVGTSRDLLVVLADAAATPSLAENQANDGTTSWDIHRTALPQGARPVATQSVSKTRA